MSSRDHMNHDFPVYLEFSILSPHLSILFKRKGSSFVPECLRKEQNVCFLLYTKNISGHLFHSSIRQIRLTFPGV